MKNKIFISFVLLYIFTGTSWAIGPHPRFLADRTSILANKVSTNSSDWQKFKLRADATGNSAFEYAVAYLATGNSAYSTKAITAADAIISAGYSGPRGDSFLNAYVYIRNIAYTYDICYPLLTDTQKINYINYMKEIVNDIWTPGYYSWSYWSIDDPMNNYYYSHLLSIAYYSLSTATENTDADAWLAKLHAELDNRMVPQLATLGKGGGWQEGENYRERSTQRMFELFDIEKTVENRDYFASINFPIECVYYQLYSIQPDNLSLTQGGDLSRVSYMVVSDYTRESMLKLAYGLRGTNEAKYVQYWLNHVYTTMKDWDSQYIYDFIYNDSSAAETNYKLVLPNTYMASGAGWWQSRSGWGPNDAVLTFVSTSHFEGHQHYDQNSFILFKNGYQIVDANSYSYSGIVQNTAVHNSITVDGNEQGNISTTTQDGVILKNSSSSTYGYVVGNAANAYNHHGSSVLTSYIREMLHVYPNIVAMIDRVVPVSSGASREILFHFHRQPTNASGTVRSSESTGKVIMKMVVPSSVALSIVNENSINSDLSSWRATWSQSSETNFITGIVVQSSSDTKNYTVSAVAGVNSQGVTITDSVDRWSVVFGVNYTPSSTDTVSFIEPIAGDFHYYYISNLQPLQSHYYKKVDNGDGTFTVTVSNSQSVVIGSQGIFVTDNSGVGYFSERGTVNKIPKAPGNLLIR
jgi:hypothetical protein